MSTILASGSQSRTSTAVPLAVVAGFLFSARSALTLALVRGFGANEQLGSILAIALSVLLLIAVCVDRICTTDGLGGPIQVPPPLRWVLLYVGFIGLSLTWSAAASVPASTGYWCGTAADVATTVLLFRSNRTHAIAAMMKGFIVGSCLIAAAAWIMPAEYDLRLGDQDYLNANTIANLSAFGFFFAQYLTRATPTRWTVVSGLLALTISRSLSKTSTAAFIISAALLFIADRSMGRGKKLVLACVATLVVLSLWGLFEAYYDLYTTTGNQAETLTGRTAIWSYAADAIPERLVFGHGFDSMWKVVPAFGTFQARHAENEVLQELYAFGIIGLSLAIAIYVSLFREAYCIAASRVRLPVMCLLAYVLVRGLAEAEPFDLLFPLWAIVLFGYLARAEASLPALPPKATHTLRPPLQSAL